MTQPLNATFFSFRKREKSGVLLSASIGFILLCIALYGGFIALFWTQLGPVFSWYGDVLSAAGKNDAAAMGQMSLPAGLGMMILAGFAFVFLICVMYAAYEAACLRWMIRGESGGGFFGLTLGADTWRVYAGYWVWFVLYMAFSIVLGMIAAAVMVPVFMSMANSGGAPDPLAFQTHPAILAVNLLQYVLLAYFGVRLAPAAATSIARRKFSFFQAWTVTKGRFWPLFGSFLLLFLVYMLFTIVFMVAMFVAVLGSTTFDFSSMTGSPQRFMEGYMQVMQTYMQSFTQPRTWIVMGVLQIVGMAVGLVLYVATFGINARAALAAIEDGKITPAAS